MCYFGPCIQQFRSILEAASGLRIKASNPDSLPPIYTTKQTLQNIECSHSLGALAEPFPWFPLFNPYNKQFRTAKPQPKTRTPFMQGRHHCFHHRRDAFQLGRGPSDSIILSCRSRTLGFVFGVLGCRPLGVHGFGCLGFWGLTSRQSVAAAVCKQSAFVSPF